MTGTDGPVVDATAGLGALTLFVDDLAAVVGFYRDVLALELLFQDEESCAFRLGGTILNLLDVRAAGDVVSPARPAPVGVAPQMMLSLWVQDVDAVCAALGERGVTLLNGPVDQPWGKRTAAFADPAGTVWEIAQDLPGAD